MHIPGIGGTAWAVGAVVSKTDDPDALRSGIGRTPDPAIDRIFIESDPYQLGSGGIHPRGAVEYIGTTIPEVAETASEHAVMRCDDDGPVVDGVALPCGPDLGSCLRIVGTAAHSAAQILNVSLLGVNHTVVYLEIGRHQSGFNSPMCLNTLGVNAHLLGYHDDRYRVLDETTNTGVGNALGRFTHHVGRAHPGGPKVKATTEGGDYVELPYIVKGMDLSFSDIMSTTKDKVDAGTPIPDICTGLQETILAVPTEVAEHALSLAGTGEPILGGGVGQNARLHEMLAKMYNQRGAKFHMPEPRSLRDNASMIAAPGVRMLVIDDMLVVERPTVDPNSRPDQVDVMWRGANESITRVYTDDGAIRGAEAAIDVGTEEVVKRRVPRAYRHPKLDDGLRCERAKTEARLTSDARHAGIRTLTVRDVDPIDGIIAFRRVGDTDPVERLNPETVRIVGECLARLYEADVVHGDPTMQSVHVGIGPDGGSHVYLVNFSFGFHTGHVEDHAMDLHVFAQSVQRITADADPLIDALEASYEAIGSAEVIARLREVESRGRYR